MKMPIVAVDSGGDLCFFKSIEAAERYLEPIDVRAGEYEVFDAEGQRLELGIDQKTTQRLPRFLGGDWTVDVTRIRSSEKASAPDLLRAHLLEGLSRLGIVPPAAIDLPSLVRLAVDHWGYS